MKTERRWRTRASAGIARSRTQPHVFAVQSAVSEIADKLGRDPKDFLLELIGPDRKLDPKALGFPADFWNFGDPYE